VTTTLNLCDWPPWVLASRQFNDDPRPIAIQGAIAADRHFFKTLDVTLDHERRAELFQDYMTVKFHLNEAQEETEGARRAIRNGYIRFLRGWGADSNSREGAVLKGWVESRLGIAPTYHKCSLRGFGNEDVETDYSPYDIDRTRGIARTNSIYGQFDLLYAYCQYELARLRKNDRWITLYRGTYDPREHLVTERLDHRNYFVKLNNLLSFTSEKERAFEFGTTVWKVEVPLVKVFYFGELLPSVPLKGENEYIVIGGEYRVAEVWG
jgi:NAD+--dinitrogen-reductase ADP-D-ribosyltransferase